MLVQLNIRHASVLLKFIQFVEELRIIGVGQATSAGIKELHPIPPLTLAKMQQGKPLG